MAGRIGQGLRGVEHLACQREKVYGDVGSASDFCGPGRKC